MKDKTVIHSNQFIIASIDFYGNWCRRSHIYDDYQNAKVQAINLAKDFPSRKWVVLAVSAVAQRNNDPVSVTYEL